MAPRKIADAVLVGLFLAGLAGYGGAGVWNAVADRAKVAATFHRPWKALPAAVEDLLTTHLAARDSLITWHGRVKAEWLGASPNPKVWIGRDGWLFYNHAAEAGFVPTYDPAFADRLDHWAAALSARRSWLATRGIHFLVVAAPDKQSIYPEYLPRLARRRGPAPLDDLLTRCGRDPDLCVLDLRDPLRAARPAGPVYRRTDSHWSPAGDYAGYAATVGALTRWFPALAPLPWSALGTKSVRTGGGDLARLMGLAARRSEVLAGLAWATPLHARPVTDGVSFEPDANLTHVPPRVWVNDAPGRPRVVLLGDSFSDDDYCTLLAEDCARLVKVGSYECQEALIERERPDVVICEFVERILEKYVPRGPR